MKRIGALLAVAAVLCFDQSEPSEIQIQTAFRSAMSNPLHAVLLTDRANRAGMLVPAAASELRSLRKLGCVKAQVSAYECDFFIDLQAGDATVRRTVTGYFLDGPGALTFAREVYRGPLPLLRAAKADAGRPTL
jgi:hypothetical protein